jgi:hypothetical protein
VRGDALELPFREEMDVVTSVGAFGHVERADEDRFVAGIVRALKPGGRFVFATSPMPKASEPWFWMAHGFNAVMRVRNAVLRPQFIMYYLTFTWPEVRQLLERHGLSTDARAGVCRIRTNAPRSSSRRRGPDEDRSRYPDDLDDVRCGLRSKNDPQTGGPVAIGAASADRIDGVHRFRGSSRRRRTGAASQPVAVDETTKSRTSRGQAQPTRRWRRRSTRRSATSPKREGQARPVRVEADARPVVRGFGETGRLPEARAGSSRSRRRPPRVSARRAAEGHLPLQRRPVVVIESLSSVCLNPDPNRAGCARDEALQELRREVPSHEPRRVQGCPERYRPASHGKFIAPRLRPDPLHVPSATLVPSAVEIALVAIVLVATAIAIARPAEATGLGGRRSPREHRGVGGSLSAVLARAAPTTHPKTTEGDDVSSNACLGTAGEHASFSRVHRTMTQDANARTVLAPFERSGDECGRAANASSSTGSIMTNLLGRRRATGRAVARSVHCG